MFIVEIEGLTYKVHFLHEYQDYYSSYRVVTQCFLSKFIGKQFFALDQFLVLAVGQAGCCWDAQFSRSVARKQALADVLLKVFIRKKIRALFWEEYFKHSPIKPKHPWRQFVRLCALLEDLSTTVAVPAVVHPEQDDKAHGDAGAVT